LMVSGFITSPRERSRMASGDAKLIVIFEKSFLIGVSFFTAIYVKFLSTKIHRFHTNRHKTGVQIYEKKMKNASFQETIFV